MDMFQEYFCQVVSRFLSTIIALMKSRRLEWFAHVSEDRLTSLSGFSFTIIRNSQESRVRGEAISVTPLFHFHPLQRHLNISRAIAAESSHLHTASSRT